MINLIRNAVDVHIMKKVPSIIEKELEKQLPNIIEHELMKSFEQKRDRQLNHIGFKWALVLYFERYWPNLSRKESISCANDCMEVPHGTDGYDWSAASAEELVKEYVDTYGEKYA